MRALLMVSTFFLLVTVAGDASARLCRKNTDFPLIDKGMTLDEVTKLIGKPVSAESGPEDSKVLFYCLASSFLDTDGSDTREYWVQMMGGKVIGYGERSDAAAMQRAQRQYAAAWGSANMIVNSANQAADRMAYTGTPAVSTQINVQQNAVVQPVAPAPETMPATDDQSKPDWRKWKPF
ncbi:hypothetical protein CSC62_02845 [Pseudoxanthomonas jiangsuensis]|uniref:hypothetical protein n=1 Tax=Pseudoxanthomonas jiangsuensis TaxID=619688 RepID=UPI001390D880|nr:hypothetical protein [Pseudoxanthomonas jiangsuensis]KAF1698898.1 hypothetical protein CSC62_02845 [Pseudoxanthomonas jiangsuensis]